ncbi:MAG: haloacid dehalogenase-like hydrolase [Gammaproteobacteria bacterium]|nr:haloacid dehalogenase-like hydrolase [Gammaproteobacteria bacterium]
MRLGLDFDNTIVNYDGLFHKVALEQGVIPADLPVTKIAVRNHLRAIGREEVWTEMQGYVYGARMDEAVAYPGALEFMAWARGAGLGLAIVSHKTKHPFLGPQYDLHAAARAWVRHHLVAAGAPLIAPPSVFFELTKEEKLARIGAIGCDLFLDDLPEILEAQSFPAGTTALLFDPDRHHAAAANGLAAIAGWDELQTWMCGRWTDLKP